MCFVFSDICCIRSVRNGDAFERLLARQWTEKKKPEDDIKDELRTDNDSYAWSTAQDQLFQLRQPASLLEFR